MKTFRCSAVLLLIASLSTLSGCALLGGSEQDHSKAAAGANGSASSGASAAAEATHTASPAAAGDVSLDPQTDEGAGKAVDLSKIAASPKTGSPYLGPKDALVLVNVFSDFQCPVCRRSADPIKQLVADFPGKVKVVFRNNALAMHGRSRPAALAAMAAAKQGKFWPYYDRLFSNQAALDDTSLRSDAQAVGLDLPQWEKDIADPKVSDRIKSESDWANRLGAAGTPAFFINGLRQVGWGSYQGIKSMVARELVESEQLAASGTPKSQISAERIKAMADKNQKLDASEVIDPALWASLLTTE